VSVDAFLDELSEEARAEMRVLLRRAYESGFREALAGAGKGAGSAPPAPIEQPGPVAPAPIAARVEWVAGPEGGAGEASEVQEGDGDEGEDDDEGETPVPRPILANAMVGTLRRRIIRTFDLERFDIDVVICRSGDPDRRQLKSSARLASYRREEG
jgi:hypothetical protein